MHFYTLLTLVLSLAAAASAAGPVAEEKRDHSPSSGTASFYSTRYNGRVTASGQRFNSNALTAASLELPMGTRVKVTNLVNHRSVIVRVNDRGPFVKGRLSSVTLRAARQLGFVKAGLANVNIEPLS